MVSRPLIVTYATAICGSGDVIGDLVYINGNITNGSYQATKADPTDTSKMPVIAVIVNKVNSTHAVIQFEGNVSIYTGLVAGKTYYLGTSGRPVNVIPIPDPGSRLQVQPIGVALDANILKFQPNARLVVLQG